MPTSSYKKCMHFLALANGLLYSINVCCKYKKYFNAAKKREKNTCCLKIHWQYIKLWFTFYSSKIRFVNDKRYASA